MLKSITVNLGKQNNLSPRKIDLNRLNVFVGPNNSGKSLLIREIYDFFRQPNQPFKIICDAEVDMGAFGYSEFITRYKQDPNEGEHQHPDHVIIQNDAGRSQIHLPQLKAWFENPKSNFNQYRQTIASPFIKYLDGASRLQLTQDRPMGDLLKTPTNPLQKIFVTPELLEKVRAILFDAFSQWLIIDPSSGGNLRLSLSDDLPNPSLEKSLSCEALEFYKSCNQINQCSDGIKSFAGMIIEIMSGDSKTIIIDEPEAFLHPTLAYKLGSIVSKLSMESDKTIIVATHSPFFLMGCMQFSNSLNLFRITYRSKESRILEVKHDDFKELIKHPLTRSIGAISGVFYDAVIVTESDNDRCFYNEINERLLEYGDNGGVYNALFLNAQNKQTIDAIVGPLRKLGICACGIYDLDLIKCGGIEFTRCLQAANVPRQMNGTLTTHRSAVNGFFQANGIDMKTQGGVSSLSGGDKITADSLLTQLSSYGIFLVPNGELESWLKPLQISGKKTEWVLNAFQAIGTDPDSPSYLKYQSDDVWEFVQKIAQWVKSYRIL